MDAGMWDRLQGRSRKFDDSLVEIERCSNVDETHFVDRLLRWPSRSCRPTSEVSDNSARRTHRGWSNDPRENSSSSREISSGTNIENVHNIRRFFQTSCFIYYVIHYVTISLQSLLRFILITVDNFKSPPLRRYSTFLFRVPVRSDDLANRSPSPITMTSRSSPLFSLYLAAFIAVMASLQSGVVMAAPTATSSRASSHFSVGKVFDGDPGEKKNFDGVAYLMQYNYLPSSDLESGALRSDDELRRSIRQFQRIAGLSQTGRFDQNTVEMMRKPRCGMSDLLNSGRWTANDNDEDTHGGHHEDHPEEIRSSMNGGHHRQQWRPQEYAFGPSKWNRTQLTFRIVNFTPDLSISEIRSAVHRALRVWSDSSRLTFHEVQTGQADILFQFATGYHHDGYPFDGAGMVLAHAFFPGEDRGGDVHFDDDETWTVYREDGVDLFTVATHELGHALGLAHSTVPGSLMFPWHQGYSENFRLHEDDIQAIQQLYGAPGDSDRNPHRPTHHRPAETPTRSPPRATTTRPPRVPPPTRRSSHVVVEEPLDGEAPDACHTNFDAVSVIRGEIFAFKDRWFWRITNNGIMDGHPVEISRFWYGLPRDLDHVDAVYERSSDGHIVFFSGQRYWSFTGTERNPMAGRPLTEFGLPEDIDRVDAAFVWGHNQRTYIISSGMYWKLGAEEHSTLSPVERHGYPRDMSMWAGVPLPVDSVFTHSDGRTYFFKGHHYWEFNNARMHVQRGHPRLIGPRWLNCSRTETSDGNDGGEFPPKSGVVSYSVLSSRLRLLHWLITFSCLSEWLIFRSS